MEKTELEALVPVPVAEPAPRRTKVAVLGFTQSFQLAPFQDPEWEIWGLNELYQFIPRWDRWFELHKRSVYEADKKRVSDHVERLKGMTCPVYMHQKWDDIPGSVPYPLEQVIARFGNYFTNSISYMMALAILEEFQEIGLYGVDMCHDSEYCLAPDSRVLTADMQWVPISNLVIGQQVMAFDESPQMEYGYRRQWRVATVDGVKELVQPCYRLTLSDENRIVASSMHRWLGPVQQRWLRTEFLKPDADGLVRVVGGHPDKRRLQGVMRGLRVGIKGVEFLGDQPVIGLQTSTGTFIAEGFASHNSSQRPSCEYIIGWAMGAGIKVTIPYQSDLLKTPYLYGYQEDEERAFNEKLKARRTELEQKAQQIDQQMAQMSEARAQYRGALQDCEHIAKIWAPSANLTMGKPPGG